MTKKNICTGYSIRSFVPATLKIAHVSDIHDTNASWAIPYLKEFQPDLICITGDTFMRNRKLKVPKCSEKQSVRQRVKRETVRTVKNVIYLLIGNRNAKREWAYAFLREASAIAPVYMSTGNHDWQFDEQDMEVIRTCGIHLLENADQLVRLKDQTLRIGGLSTIRDREWLQRFTQQPEKKILLCHHPEYAVSMAQNGMQCDLVLCGHAHGGQMCIGKRPLYAPGQGLFPQYVHGCYTLTSPEGRTTEMIVSAGCANTIIVPRFGNPCEIGTICLVHPD